MSIKEQYRRELAVATRLRQFPPPPAVFYNIGVGHKTEWQTFKKVYPALQVFGCEPNPAMYAELKPIYPGELWQEAIALQPGEIELRVSLLNPKNASVIPGAECGSLHKVPAMTLDMFDERAGCPSNIFLWMDIEGYELQALQSAPKLLASGRVRWMNLEARKSGVAAPATWTEAKEMHDFLKAAGYLRIAEHSVCRTHYDVLYLRSARKKRSCGANGCCG